MPNLLRIRSAFNALYSHRRSRAGHIIRDGLLALAIFGFLAAIIGWQSAPQLGIQASDVLASGSSVSQLLRTEPNHPGTTAVMNAAMSLPQLNSRALLHPDNRGLTVAILASVFAVIFVFNLWFLRHLGRVHAASRPARNRKG